MSIGTLKWFSDAKGYGFIAPNEGGKELFAHFSAVDASGFKTLRQNAQVQFDMAEGPRGPHAINIRLI